MPFDGAVSRIEVLAALSLAVDLGLGSPLKEDRFVLVPQVA